MDTTNCSYPKDISKSGEIELRDCFLKKQPVGQFLHGRDGSGLNSQKLFHKNCLLAAPLGEMYQIFVTECMETIAYSGF